MGSVKDKIERLIAENKIMIFSKTYCPYCKKAKDVFNGIKAEYEVLELDKISDGADYQAVLLQMTGAKSVPRVFINGECIGGGDETAQLQRDGKLLAKIAG